MTTREILDGLEQVAGKAAVDLVEFKEDPALRKIVDTWAPDYNTERAYSLGLTSDKSGLSVTGRADVNP